MKKRGRKKKVLREETFSYLGERDTPEWKAQTEAIMKLQSKGYDTDTICTLTQIPHATIKRIIDEEDLTNQLIKKQWKEKVPLMRDVITMGLYGIRETLKQFADPQVREQMIQSPQDLVALTKVVESLNMLIRLEEGKSTANVATNHNHSFKQTKDMLIELSKMDPVFEYGLEALPEPVEAIDAEIAEIFEKVPVELDGKE